MNKQDRDIKQACRFVLSHPLAPPAAETLARLAAHPAAVDAIDDYGAGGAVARLEQATTERLGKDAGLFFIKGVTAQLCVLRAYAEARGCNNVVIHPMSHMDIDEAGAIERVAGLHAIRLGRFTPFTAQALAALTEPLAAVVVELPLRRAGFLLPEFDALRAISAWCRERSIPLHFDGARLWEAAAGYGVSEAELAALADSVYVSYYKGLGGLGGAMVAGSQAFVDALRVWKTRYGGDLFTAYPYAISALDGLERLAPRMREFVDRARALAAGLADIPNLIVHPNPPHTNAFQVWLPGTPSVLAEQHRQFAAAHKLWLFERFSEAPLVGHAMAEIQLGPASDHYAITQAVDAVRQFMSKRAEGIINR
ncbi:MAG: beta-eliminating lyase-related protein [Rhodanobacter sp.]|jgi:threonine aldolase|nr:beta-eliminating lyase-related protein [Rhodanobacter sp.]